MSKIYLKCYHQNVTYKTTIKNGCTIISDVRCVNCEQEMPSAWKEAIEAHYSDSSDTTPRVFPTLEKNIVFKIEKAIN